MGGLIFGITELCASDCLCFVFRLTQTSRLAQRHDGTNTAAHIQGRIQIINYITF